MNLFYTSANSNNADVLMRHRVTEAQRTDRQRVIAATVRKVCAS